MTHQANSTYRTSSARRCGTALAVLGGEGRGRRIVHIIIYLSRQRRRQMRPGRAQMPCADDVCTGMCLRCCSGREREQCSGGSGCCPYLQTHRRCHALHPSSTCACARPPAHHVNWSGVGLSTQLSCSLMAPSVMQGSLKGVTWTPWAVQMGVLLNMNSAWGARVRFRARGQAGGRTSASMSVGCGGEGFSRVRARMHHARACTRRKATTCCKGDWRIKSSLAGIGPTGRFGTHARGHDVGFGAVTRSSLLWSSCALAHDGDELTMQCLLARVHV